ncbi:hypothetical protein GE09DRAFT_1240159 [Coniochaeta sp. 2T2.1]|nr:hypothetical protein GE09DRAFT_1240159 [Coniochaeta sp. 2T2.1]
MSNQHSHFVLTSSGHAKRLTFEAISAAIQYPPGKYLGDSPNTHGGHRRKRASSEPRLPSLSPPFVPQDGVFATPLNYPSVSGCLDTLVKDRIDPVTKERVRCIAGEVKKIVHCSYLETDEILGQEDPDFFARLEQRMKTKRRSKYFENGSLFKVPTDASAIKSSSHIHMAAPDHKHDDLHQLLLGQHRWVQGTSGQPPMLEHEYRTIIDKQPVADRKLFMIGEWLRYYDDAQQFRELYDNTGTADILTACTASTSTAASTLGSVTGLGSGVWCSFGTAMWTVRPKRTLVLVCMSILMEGGRYEPRRWATETLFSLRRRRPSRLCGSFTVVYLVRIWWTDHGLVGKAGQSPARARTLSLTEAEYDENADPAEVKKPGLAAMGGPGVYSKELRG